MLSVYGQSHIQSQFKELAFCVENLGINKKIFKLFLNLMTTDRNPK